MTARWRGGAAAVAAVAVNGAVEHPEMQGARPSRTALGAAAHRAAHQILEHGAIFSDPLALKILGDEAGAAIRRATAEPALRGLRLFIAARTRFAEDAVTAAIAQGTGQVVVLGAGLDTYSYRASVADGVRIFEVDHPATQAWKRAQLDAAAIAIPATLTFAPVDFESESLDIGLRAAGFDSQRSSFFTWLGVVPYLSEPAVLATLRWIAGLPGGARVIFDYANPPVGVARDPRAAAIERLAARVARIGEPIRSWYETTALLEMLAAMGLDAVEDIGPAEIAARYGTGKLPRGSPALDHHTGHDNRGDHDNRGGHIVHAASVSRRAPA